MAIFVPWSWRWLWLWELGDVIAIMTNEIIEKEKAKERQVVRG